MANGTGRRSHVGSASRHPGQAGSAHHLSLVSYPAYHKRPARLVSSHSGPSVPARYRPVALGFSSLSCCHLMTSGLSSYWQRESDKRHEGGGVLLCLAREVRLTTTFSAGPDPALQGSCPQTPCLEPLWAGLGQTFYFSASQICADCAPWVHPFISLPSAGLQSSISRVTEAGGLS